MNHIYISDTNIWIDFRNAGLLDALFQLPATLCCTDFVLEELADFDHQKLARNGLLVERLEPAAINTLSGMMVAHNNSSLADLSCYLLAQQTGHFLLTGDGQLRKQAQRDGLEVRGALWLLDQLVDHQIIEAAQAASALEEMLALGARLPAMECAIRLRSWKK